MKRLTDWRYSNPMSEPDAKRKIERSKTFAAGFTQSNILRNESAITQCIEQLLDHMDDFARRGAPMPLDKFFTYTAFDVVGEVLCSKPFGFLREGKDVNNAIQTNSYFQDLVTWVSHLRELHVLVNPLFTYLKLTPTSWLAETAFAAVEDRKKRPVEKFDMLSHWFKYVEQNPDKASMREIMAQATNVTAAGSDTTSCLLQSTIYHLLRKPETMRRARAEVDEQKSDKPDGGRVPPFSALRELPYLAACVKEALRVHPPIPATLPRLSPGLEIGGRYFPEGITLSGSPWVLHHAKALWGDDVGDFKPERWLEPDAGARLDRYFMPFGVGFMSCPGQHLARIEAYKVLASILSEYDLRLVDPEKEWESKMCFAQVPHSWPVYVSKRQRA